MKTALYTHDACFAHDTGYGHPECSDRLRFVLRGLDAPEFAGLDRREAPLATVNQIARVHRPNYITSLLERVPQEGHVMADPDTVISPGSGTAALRAAGAVCAAVDAVMGGEVSNAFCAVRPPGHHAEPTRSMGFCFFNNVAVGALHARAVHGIQRIAVVDFDVHHGNGTQSMFQADPDLFYASTHQWPLYPGTGDSRDHGVADNILNLPLPEESGSADFRTAIEGRLLPALDRFRPELMMISAGFDAHEHDPLAGLNLKDDDYAWVTDRLMEVARRHACGRLVSVLEGGYNLNALMSASQAHVRALMRS